MSPRRDEQQQQGKICCFWSVHCWVSQYVWVEPFDQIVPSGAVRRPPGLPKEPSQGPPKGPSAKTSCRVSQVHDMDASHPGTLCGSVFDTSRTVPVVPEAQKKPKRTPKMRLITFGLCSFTDWWGAMDVWARKSERKWKWKLNAEIKFLLRLL